MSVPNTGPAAPNTSDQLDVQELRVKYDAQIKAMSALSGEEKGRAFVKLLELLPNTRESMKLLANLLLQMSATDQAAIQDRLAKDMFILSGDPRVQAYMVLALVLPNTRQSKAVLTDIAMDMTATEQITLYERLGGNAKEAVARHPELTTEDEGLKKEITVAQEKAKKWRNRAFWVSLAGGMALPEKFFGPFVAPDKSFSTRYILKTIYASLFALAAFVVTNLIAFRKFTGTNWGANDFGVKEKENSIASRSLVLAKKAHTVFAEYEFPTVLKAFMDMQEQERVANPATGTDNYNRSNLSAQVPRASTAQPDGPMEDYHRQRFEEWKKTQEKCEAEEKKTVAFQGSSMSLQHGGNQPIHRSQLGAAFAEDTPSLPTHA